MRHVARLLTVVLLLTVIPAVATSGPASAVEQDALTRRIRAELASFTGWLKTHRVKGYIGEVGWPVDPSWNAAADAWYADADAAGLWVTAWAAGEWWGDYPLAVYSPDGPNLQAAVVERHLGAAGLGGVNVAGGEFAAPTIDATSAFSNVNRGTYDRDYHYDSQASFDQLARRGVELVRIPFRWERLQPAIGRPLDPAELTRLKAVVGRAAKAGLRVVLDMHNYGGYYRSDGTKGVRLALGTTQLTRFDFADVWGRISLSFKSNRAVVGYGLMNEPVAMPSADAWERVSQEAVNRIRRNGDRKVVLVGGYEWSGAQRFAQVHPRPWIHDPAGNLRYEAHHYFDRDNSGDYPDTYAAEVADAERRGY